jgi:hypothetical protein
MMFGDNRLNRILLRTLYPYAGIPMHPFLPVEQEG